MQVARHTRPKGHIKVWATMYNKTNSGGRCHLHVHVLLGLKQGYPFYSPYRCTFVGLGIISPKPGW